jgi:hypothetical protein
MKETCRREYRVAVMVGRPMERVLGPQMGDFVHALQKSVVWFSIFKIP